VKTRRGRPAANPSGSDNLLAGVWALVSCKYSLFGVQRGFEAEACSSSIQCYDWPPIGIDGDRHSSVMRLWIHTHRN
jgi:hypothetical protein